MASCAGGSPRIARVKNSPRIGSNHGEKQGLSTYSEPIICKKLLFLHRYGIEQSARFQADIHFAVRICHGRVFLTGTTGGGCDKHLLALNTP